MKIFLQGAAYTIVGGLIGLLIGWVSFRIFASPFAHWDAGASWSYGAIIGAGYWAWLGLQQRIVALERQVQQAHLAIGVLSRAQHEDSSK